jgi:glycerol-3-phosphate dehydrogenase
MNNETMNNELSLPSMSQRTTPHSPLATRHSSLAASFVLQAQVRYAIEVEMAQTLSDVVFRRTELGSAGRPDEACVRLCLQTMAAELGWDERRSEREWREVYDGRYRAVEIGR